MAKYRKKPVVVEATQWNFMGDHPAVKEGWKDYTGQVSVIPDVYGKCKVAIIETLEGWHIVSPGDYIITGINGELYPCKPEIFEATYEPAE